ncbi:thioredoxin family protein [Runella sp.]|jgi:thiol:disulfide interchange protein|uniref:thioredoxin family protein n=1 Tax=Runella sp. TaxID=1960881 RepID=UPI002620CE50|nr:thioredoxin family protein [Runella sp.]
MQRFLSAFALAAVMLSGIAATTPKANTVSAADTGIQFVELPWSKALQKAKKEKKLIFFDAYTSWCGPCKMLQKTVFTRSDVGTYFNATFINIKKDMEIGEGPQLANMYPIEGYPTLFFINGNGKIVTSHLGALDGPELVKLAKMVASKK